MVVFDQLVNAHIITGSIGILSMWGPVLTRKGSRLHRVWGKVFVYAMLSTGSIAVGISICSLIAPLETHLFSQDAILIRGLFGWMMLYLGILTVALAWHSWAALSARRCDQARRSRWNIALQVAMAVSAVYCAIYGFAIGQYLMVGVALPGLAAALLNIHYMTQRKPPQSEWLVQHFRAGIGAGISVYTAFFAFGAVNWFPALAFNPWLWSLPTVLGTAYMIHHQLTVFRQRVRAGRAHELPVGRYFAHWVVDRPADRKPKFHPHPAGSIPQSPSTTEKVVASPNCN